MGSRYISFHVRRVHAENVRNICLLSAFVKVPLAWIDGEA
jgi:hypothetical protein